MKVADLLVTDLAVVNQDISNREAVIQLPDARVHAMPTDEMLDDTVVRDIMTTPPKTIGPGEDVRAAAKQMLQLDVHRLFVVEKTDLLGVIAQSDIVRAVADGRL